MDYLHTLLVVLLFCMMTVAPLLSLVYGWRTLTMRTLSAKQRQFSYKQLREGNIVREGDAWEARDLDELMLNMRRYDTWKIMGLAITVLLTGGVGMVALFAGVGGSIFSFGYMIPILGMAAGSFALGGCIGYITSDRRFATYADTLPEPHAEAIFTGASSIARRSWWVRVLDVGLIVGVSLCTLLYALGKGGVIDNPSTRAAVVRSPWVIWFIPVGLCVIVATQELLAWWETRRPPLQLTEQSELAGRADLYRRREACKGLNDSSSVGVLSLLQIIAISSQALFSIEFPLLIVALVALSVGAFVHMLPDSRRLRRGQRVGDTGVRGEGGVV